jgi:hypothetical protein
MKKAFEEHLRQRLDIAIVHKNHQGSYRITNYDRK